MPASKTVYHVWISHGASTIKYTTKPTMELAQWVAKQQRKQGKEVTIVPESR